MDRAPPSKDIVGAFAGRDSGNAVGQRFVPWRSLVASLRVQRHHYVVASGYRPRSRDGHRLLDTNRRALAILQRGRSGLAPIDGRLVVHGATLAGVAAFRRDRRRLEEMHVQSWFRAQPTGVVQLVGAGAHLVLTARRAQVPPLRLQLCRIASLVVEAVAEDKVVGAVGLLALQQ